MVGAAGGAFPLAQDRLHVECAPPGALVFCALCHVADHDVRVQLRIRRRILAHGTRPTVLDHDADKAVRGVPLDAVVADAYADRLALEQLERGRDAGAVRLENLAPRLLIAEGECEADALGRAEGEIPATDTLQLDEPPDDLTRLGIKRPAPNEPISLGTTQREPGLRITPLDQADDRARLGRALEAEQLRTGAPPRARPLTPLRVVIVQAATERMLVIRSTSEIHRRNAQHKRRLARGTPRRVLLPAAPRLRSPRSRRATRTPGPDSRPVMAER